MMRLWSWSIHTIYTVCQCDMLCHNTEQAALYLQYANKAHMKLDQAYGLGAALSSNKAAQIAQIELPHTQKDA